MLTTKCPMCGDLSKDCIKSRCAWFDEESNMCCVKSFVMSRVMYESKSSQEDKVDDVIAADSAD
jgi:hypothetical protein